MLLLLVCATPACGYQEEFIDVQPSGFHMTSVAHEVETNQIVINVTVSAGQNSVPLMFLSKEDSAASTLDILQHPCEGSANDDDVCCLNALASDYQLAPDMQGLYNNSRVCPWDGNAGAFVKNMSENSLYNPELSVRLPPGAIANSEFLSTGRQYWMENMSNTTENVWFTCYEPCPVEEAAGSDGNATNATTNATSRRLLQASNEVADVSYCHVLCTPDANGSFANGTNFTEHRENVTMNWQEPRSQLLYPEQVSYTVLSQDGDSFDVELRLTHAYLLPRAKHTDLGSGLSKYEFTLGATFVELLSHTASVSITSVQTTLDYFKTEFVFLSISSEQARTPLDTLGVEIHQATSASDGGQYQWILLDADYDRVRYPGVATIKPDSLRWARVPTLADATGAAWQYPCRAGDGYYYADAAGMTALADVAQQTDCLPDVPLWCRFNTDEDFFLPLPTSSAMSGGYISGPDTTTNIYLSGVLELTDGNGFKHLSTFFVSIDLDGYPVLAHCKDQTFKYNDVSDAIAITARVGVKPESESAVRLDQTITQNRNLNEMVASSAPTGRRLLSVDGKETEVAAEPEFVREGRRLLQSSGGNACAEPICGHGEGMDVDTCVNVSIGGGNYAHYQCKKCDKAVFAPNEYNQTQFWCGWGGCTVQRNDNEWYAWIIANSGNVLPQVTGDIKNVALIEWKDLATPKIYKWTGFSSAVAVMPDNTIRRWGSGGVVFDSETALVSFPHDENIVDVAASALGAAYLVLTTNGKTYHSDDLSVAVDWGTSKRVSHIAGFNFGVFCVFNDGTVKSIGAASYGLNGYGGTVEYTHLTVKDAPFIDFGVHASGPFAGQPRKVHKMKSQASAKMVNLFKCGDSGTWNKCDGGNTYDVKYCSCSNVLGEPQYNANWQFTASQRCSNCVWGGGSPNIKNNDYFARTTTGEHSHMCAILQGGEFVCWGGYNEFGQLGQEDMVKRHMVEPKDVPSINVGTGRSVIDYSAGAINTCVVLDNYKVKCFGAGMLGTNGYFDPHDRGDLPGTMGDALPYLDFGDHAILRVESYLNVMCALDDSDQIKCWGGVCSSGNTGSFIPSSSGPGSWRVRHEYSLYCHNWGSGRTWHPDYQRPGITKPISLRDPWSYANEYPDVRDYRLLGTWPIAFGDTESKNRLITSNQKLDPRKRAQSARCGSLKIASVKTKAELPLTVETFTETLQEEYVSTVAIVAGVSDDQVEIVSITPTGARRRLLQESGIEVETEITDDGSNSLSSIEEQLTTDNINNFLQTNPASSLPPITLGALETVEEVVEGTTFDFIGASSYAEAAISLELDAVTFMQIPYAANYKLRVDSVLVFNFLGVGHFEVIRNLIRAGTGFNMTRDGADLYYTLTPNFGDAVVCDQVTSTVSIAPSQFSCFWRRAITDNVVSPEASESLYYYRQGGDADVTNAKEWIRDTLLGGDHGFANDTAAEYFQRSCSRNNDTAAEPRSYACLYVDPGYRL